MQINNTKPPLESLACCHPACDLYGQSGQNNLAIRKIYGHDKIRYLRCRACQTEFSERKLTPLWNCKIREATAISIGEHLGEGCGFKPTARLTRTNPETVRRLCRKFGTHSQAFHDQNVIDVVVDSLQADERHSYVSNKKNRVWEAEIIDPESKFVLSHVQGARNHDLIRRLLTDGAGRLLNRHGIVLFTDGFASYGSLFPEIFGEPYAKYRHTNRGRPGKPIYRIPRQLAHVQIMKKYRKKRVSSVKIVYKHGTQRRVHEALDRLQHFTPNTSTIERRNATARRMNATMVRRTLGFSRHELSKRALGLWTMTIYNWCREHRMLKQPLKTALDKPKWILRTPAMALGLANRILTIREILLTPLYEGGGMG